MIVVEQIATPCATRPSSSERARNGTCWKVGPRTPVTTPPRMSSTVISAALDSHLVTIGVTTAAAP
jgi:hypothetical protein